MDLLPRMQLGLQDKQPKNSHTYFEMGLQAVLKENTMYSHTKPSHAYAED